MATKKTTGTADTPEGATSTEQFEDLTTVGARVAALEAGVLAFNARLAALEAGVLALSGDVSELEDAASADASVQPNESAGGLVEALAHRIKRLEQMGGV